MRNLGVMLGVFAGGWMALAGGCQLIAGVKDATLYPEDAGTGGGGQGGEGGSGGSTNCAPGSKIGCYSGPTGTKGVGICAAGQQTCRMDGSGYDACVGDVGPKAESCAAAADENCDGYDCVQWAELFGDTGDQLTTNIAVDAVGNSFVGGSFTGVIPFGADVIKSTGSTDGFLLKFSPTGTPIWGMSFGDANSYQSITAIATDSDGNALITGFSFSSLNIGDAALPAGPFVAKFDKNGKFAWGKGLVASSCASVSLGSARIAVTPQNDVILAGSFCGTLDFGDGPLVSQGSNVSNGFIAKLRGNDGSGKASDGGWTTVFGDGQNAQAASDVSVAPTGDIVVVGNFSGSLTLKSSYQSGSGVNIFVAQLTSAGVATWIANLGGAADAQGAKIAVDKFGGPVILGSFSDSISLDGNVINSIGGTENGLVVKMSTDKSIEWYKQVPIGAFGSVAIDTKGNIFLTGLFKGSLDLGAGPLNAPGMEFDPFLAKLTKGGSVVWNKRFAGATQVLSIFGVVATNGADEPIMAGVTNIPVDFGTGILTPISGEDGFLAKFSP